VSAVFSPSLDVGQIFEGNMLQIVNFHCEGLFPGIYLPTKFIL
jgi:hypothetical protein